MFIGSLAVIMVLVFFVAGCISPLGIFNTDSRDNLFETLVLNFILSVFATIFVLSIINGFLILGFYFSLAVLIAVTLTIIGFYNKIFNKRGK